MLKKLLKYEFLATGRVLLPLGAGTLGLSALAALILHLGVTMPGLEDQLWYTVLLMLVMFVAVLGLLATFLLCLFVNVQRFYKLLGQQGYLMMTLPVTTGQQIAAKLICAMAETIAAVGLLSGCMGLLLRGTGEAGDMASSFAPFAAQPEALAVMLYMLLLMLLGLAGSYLFFYLCIAIGGQWPQQRLVASIATFFIAQFVLQIAMLALMAMVGVALYANAGPLESLIRSLNTPNGSMIALGGLCTGVVLVLVACDAALWAVTHHLMTKKLNLA